MWLDYLEEKLHELLTSKPEPFTDINLSDNRAKDFDHVMKWKEGTTEKILTYMWFFCCVGIILYFVLTL